MSKKPSQNQNGSKIETEIELTFDGNRVRSSWYHPDLAPVLCSLCGKGCNTCTNTNPYCG